MPREARKLGKFNHVIIRGIGKQILFEDDYDRRMYLGLLRKYRDETDITILAYCLMDNHVHLLLEDNDYSLPVFMKKLGVSYAAYFNNKYERTGHLFQDRYKSEIVDNDRYLFNVYRYILKNPEKAGIASCKCYPWNSFHEFGTRNGITDTRFLESIIGDYNAFLLYMCCENDENQYMEYEHKKRDDSHAIETIKTTLNINNIVAIQNMKKSERDFALSVLKKRGLSIRQIERLTGINRGVVMRA